MYFPTKKRIFVKKFCCIVMPEIGKEKTFKMKKLTILFFAALILSACNRVQNGGDNGVEVIEYPAEDIVNQDEIKQSDDFYLNQTDQSNANDLARFLAGKPVDKYADLQNTPFYKEYSLKTAQQWEDLTTRTLEPIKKWCKENINDFSSDTSCLIYPFGGPDLIFAMTFFPNAGDYILQGLENPGKLAEPDKISQPKIQAYLDSLLYSFRYLTRFGFFVAGQMQQDFRNEHLDGTLHLALYTLAMENCIITNYRDIYLDNRGNITEADGNETKHPYGWEIVFKKDGDKKPRTVKYFRMDTSDPPLMGKMEFPFFVNSFKEKICYLKSASYLLQSVEFKIMQKLVVDQCDKILQDESGLAYGKLIKDYDVKLFGTYTRPLKVFSIFKQEDLKEALAAKKSQPLPFKIGYASQLNESVLMACTRKTADSPVEEAKPSKPVVYTKDTVYKVQFRVSWKKLPESDFAGLQDVDYYLDNSAYKYTSGNFKTEQECKEYLPQVRAKGFSDAFIVKFYSGKRIK